MRIRAAPLIVQVMGLLAVGLVAAQLLTAAILFFLPPPAPEVYRIAQIARALGGGPVPERLVLSAGPAPAMEPRRGASRFQNRLAAADLAQLLHVGPDQVRVAERRSRPLFDPVIRFGRPPMPFRGQDGGRGGPRGPRLDQGSGGWGQRETVLFGEFTASAHQADGGWLTVQPRRNGLPQVWRQRILIWLAACMVLLAPLAWLFARRLTAPIAAFAKAAERLGRDPRAAPLALDGPAEVRLAASAFNDMQERLRLYVDHRTAIIGAVAHDLRTPLTRMRFLLEAPPEAARAKMEREIDEMDAMIAAALAFVKDASAASQRVRLDLAALVEAQVADLAETGRPFTCHCEAPVLVLGDPVALRRLFGNLLANAGKFAGGAEVSVRAEGPEAVVLVEDRGPGIPEAELDQVFEPFYRTEASRSRETGGAGLGLAVVRSVARAHGGDATLTARAGGGLSCQVRLPLDG